MTKTTEIPDSARAPDGHLCLRCQFVFDEGSDIGQWVSCPRLRPPTPQERAALGVLLTNVGAAEILKIIASWIGANYEDDPRVLPNSVDKAKTDIFRAAKIVSQLDTAQGRP